MNNEYVSYIRCGWYRYSKRFEHQSRAVKENPKLVDAWKKLDDLGADNALKNDPKVLDYVNSGRKNEINLDVEEVLGGHSKFRHGSHLTYNDMKLRAL